MSATAKKAAEPAADSGNRRAFRRVYEYADRALELVEQHETPPYPSTYALWYAYVSRSSKELVSTVNEMLERGPLTPYDIDEVCREHLSEKETVDAQDSIGQQFEKQLASVLNLIETGVSNSDRFEATLHQIEEGLPGQVSPERLSAAVSKLLAENRQMADQSRELNTGLRESRKQIEKLSRELEDVRNQSMRDPLTGVANRRAFDGRLSAAMIAAEETGESLCLALADLDHFKQVNDTYGHRVGDEVLKVFASIITENIKGQDMAARYGGEEFAIILPNTAPEAAFKLVDSIREKFARTELVFKHSNRTLGELTASFGISQFSAGMTACELIEEADQLLYASKNAGRNRVRMTAKAEGSASALRG